MKVLKFIWENIVISFLGTLISFMLRFYDRPKYGVFEAVMEQMLRNFAIIFVVLTVARMVTPFIKKWSLTWDRKKAERYEMLIILFWYGFLLLLVYVLLESRTWFVYEH